jgi:hypothetical protein
MDDVSALALQTDDAALLATEESRAGQFFGISMTGQSVDELADIEVLRAKELGLTVDEYRLYRPNLALWKEIRAGFSFLPERIRVALQDDRDLLPIMPLWPEDLGTSTVQFRRWFIFERSLEIPLLDWQALKEPLVRKALDSLVFLRSTKLRLEPEVVKWWTAVVDAKEGDFVQGNFPKWSRGRSTTPSHCVAIRLICD